MIAVVMMMVMRGAGRRFGPDVIGDRLGVSAARNEQQSDDHHPFEPERMHGEPDFHQRTRVSL
jgi:hypothetical protein